MLESLVYLAGQQNHLTDDSLSQWTDFKGVLHKLTSLFFFQDIMTDASTRQKDADEVFTLGRSAIDSGLLENEQANEVHDRMTDLNHRWNGLNIDVIEREKRLVFAMFSASSMLRASILELRI